MNAEFKTQLVSLILNNREDFENWLTETYLDAWDAQYDLKRDGKDLDTTDNRCENAVYCAQYAVDELISKISKEAE